MTRQCRNCGEVAGTGTLCPRVPGAEGLAGAHSFEDVADDSPPRKPHKIVPQDRYLEALRELPHGGELASFADLFNVSHATAKRKLDGLVGQGVAERLPSQGFGPIYRLAAGAPR